SYGRHIDSSTFTPLQLYFNDSAHIEIYTLSLHDALPISKSLASSYPMPPDAPVMRAVLVLFFSVIELELESAAKYAGATIYAARSEEHTSELQSPYDIVCRLLLEKKKITNNTT